MEKELLDTQKVINEIMANPDKAKQLLAELKGKYVLTLCVSCGKVFVNMPFPDFLKVHSFPEPDRWFFEVGVHYTQNPTHKILGYSTDNPAYNFSTQFKEACLRYRCSLAQLEEAYKKKVKETGNKPI